MFQTLDGQIHITVAGNHYYFGFRILKFDPAKQFDAVHDRHSDIGEHYGWVNLLDDPEGFLTIFCCINFVAEVGQRYAENITDVFFIIDK